MHEQCLDVLRGRTVTLFPDLGATDYWRSKIPMMRSLGIDIHLYDYLERAATDEQRIQGLDIADFLLDIETVEGRFEQIKQANPPSGNWQTCFNYSQFMDGRMVLSNVGTL